MKKINKNEQFQNAGSSFCFWVAKLPNNGFSRTLTYRKICKFSWHVSTFLAHRACNLADYKFFSLYLRSVHRPTVAICGQGFLTFNSRSKLIFVVFPQDQRSLTLFEIVPLNSKVSQKYETSTCNLKIHY